MWDYFSSVWSFGLCASRFLVSPILFVDSWTVTLLCFVSLWILWFVCVCVCACAQSCLTLRNPMDYVVPGVLQARILEWAAFPFSSGSSPPRNGTRVSCISHIGRQVLYQLSHEGSPLRFVNFLIFLLGNFFILGKGLFQALFCFVFNQEIRCNKSPKPL